MDKIIIGSTRSDTRKIEKFIIQPSKPKINRVVSIKQQQVMIKGINSAIVQDNQQIFPPNHDVIDDSATNRLVENQQIQVQEQLPILNMMNNNVKEDNEEVLKKNKIYDLNKLEIKQSRNLIFLNPENQLIMNQINLLIQEINKQRLQYNTTQVKFPFSYFQINFKQPLRANRRKKIWQKLGLNLRFYTKEYKH